ncbi:MAG: AAA family ATPase [Trueperaceae bacterium]
MRLEHIKVKGFKSFQEIDVRLNNLNVLIGANGAGKSNFITLFRMLNHMVDPGLGLQLFVAKNGGADSFLHYGRKVTSSITLDLEFGKNSYTCEWTPTLDDRLVFARESVHYLIEKDNWTAQRLNTGHPESELPEAGKASPNKVPGYVLRSLSNWRVFHFHDTSDSAAVKRTGQINDNISLRGDASNLAAFLLVLKRRFPNSYESIRRSIQSVAPFFDDFVLRPMAENPNSIRLEWREKGSDFPFLAHHFSDGTLRLICLATVLLQPTPPSTILIDEPELGLHPFALNILAGLMRKTAFKTQLIISTQSTHLVNQFALDDLLIVNRKDAASTIERLSTPEYEHWLEDYSLGELWEKDVIGGQPS